MKIDLEKLREYFADDRFAAAAGIVIDSATEDNVRCSMEIGALHKNAGGVVQGGAIFTLADLCFAVHANLGRLCGADEGITVGQSCSISFLKSGTGGSLTAESTCLSRGRTMSVYRITVKDNLGNAVAEMHGNGFTTRKR
ncbi:MAG: PaaI family thioesterase [Treponema sp.]|jgi:acyl-CoA thioesterase|nr:PaaI family thioesterase [Treponema sp.]